ncbi:MAG TPA: HEPN domain-containing protein [Actinomycetota bacterium]
MSRDERIVDVSAAGRYLEKAEEFLRACTAAIDRGDPTVGVSTAVHAGICAVDAYLAHEHGVRSVAADHHASVKLLREKGGPQVREQCNDLERLIAQKSKAEYGDRLSTPKEAATAATRAERLVAWVRDQTKGAKQ